MTARHCLSREVCFVWCRLSIINSDWPAISINRHHVTQVWVTLLEKFCGDQLGDLSLNFPRLTNGGHITGSHEHATQDGSRLFTLPPGLPGLDQCVKFILFPEKTKNEVSQCDVILYLTKRVPDRRVSDTHCWDVERGRWLIFRLKRWRNTRMSPFGWHLFFFTN